MPHMNLKIGRLFEIIEKGSPLLWTVAGVIIICFLGIIDYFTVNEISIALFYLAPIVLTAWSVSQDLGLFMSVLSALSWLIVEYAVGQRYAHPSIYFLNTFIRIGFFAIVTFLVVELQKARKEERMAARIDYVTGAVNARYFNELLQREVERIRRYPHPITVVFIDVDNFKLVNDLFGHRVGDEVLRSIASELRSQLRKTDIIARLGGDEFVMLLPSARQSEAEVVLSKVRPHLIMAMKKKNWPVTFSMGAVTCVTPPPSAEHLVNMADEVMYEVKRSTKDGVRFVTWRAKNGRH
jgi:diguanylate cyclase (GGDEF)-like protein